MAALHSCCMNQLQEHPVIFLLLCFCLAETQYDVNEVIFNGRRYTVFRQTKSWQEARSDCTRSGSALATPTTSTALDRLSVLGNADMWIGLRRANNSFAWIDGSRLVQVSLETTNSTNDLGDSSDSCVVQRSVSGGTSTLAQEKCSATNWFICEESSSKFQNDISP